MAPRSKPSSTRVWVRVVIAACVLLFILLLYYIRAVLTPFAISFVIAYLLDPLIDKLEARKIPRAASILSLMSITLVIAILGSIYIFDYVYTELNILSKKTDTYMIVLKDKVIPWIEQKTGYDVKISVEDLKQYTRQLLETVQNIWVKGDPPDPDKITMSSGHHRIIGLIGNIIKKVLLWIYSVISQVFALINIIIVPIATFYLLKDIDKIKAVIEDNLPRQYKDSIVKRVKEIDEVLSSFIRGQLTVCIILGVLYSTGLLVVGVDFAIIIGFVAGLANIVPYFGLVVGILPALILSVLEYQDLLHPLFVVVVFTLVQTLEGTVITPKIVGEKVGLHPVLVMIAILVGGELFGFPGILVAVPTAAVLMVLFRALHQSYRQSTFFLGKNPTGKT